MSGTHGMPPDLAAGFDPSGPSQLDAYLDGQLTGAALAAFEGRLAADAELRGEVELQHRINASLGRSFANEVVPSIVPQAATPPAARTAAPITRAVVARLWVNHHAKWVAMAASLLLAAVVFATAYIMSSSKPKDCSDVPFQELSVPYVNALEPAFEPDHPWGQNDQGAGEFAAEVQSRLGQPIQMTTPDRRVRMQGWSGSKWSVLSPDTVALFGRTEDGPVVVIIDRLSADRPLDLARGSRLIKHRRELGTLVMYEVGMSEKAVLLDKFSPR